MSELFIFFLAIIGIGMFLLFEHPLIFWLIALPIFLLIVVGFISWVRKG
jgi:hypothetical protein